MPTDYNLAQPLIDFLQLNSQEVTRLVSRQCCSTAKTMHYPLINMEGIALFRRFALILYEISTIAEVPGKALRLFYGHVHTEKTEFQ